MIFICIYLPSLWSFTCFGGAPCLIVYAPESHTLSNYRVRFVSGKKKKYQDCYHPSTDIDPRAKALCPISVSRDDNSLDMEKGMH